MKWVKQNSSYLQGHFDYFHSGKGSPAEPKNKSYMKGWLTAARKNESMIKRRKRRRSA